MPIIGFPGCSVKALLWDIQLPICRDSNTMAQQNPFLFDPFEHYAKNSIYRNLSQSRRNLTKQNEGFERTSNYYMHRTPSHVQTIAWNDAKLSF